MDKYIQRKKQQHFNIGSFVIRIFYSFITDIFKIYETPFLIKKKIRFALPHFFLQISIQKLITANPFDIKKLENKNSQEKFVCYRR